MFSADEADAIGIVGACSYQPDKQALLTRPSALSLSDDGPAVLIVHTHSSEAYTMEAGFEYQESDALRTLDEQYSVIRVGDEIADILTEAGISVLHDTQPNDYPNYNGAYERMRQTIEGYLAEYPSIQMVLDIHRDAAEDADGNPVALTAEADGEACAELMLVVGTDEGGLSHPDWQENLANALKIQTLLNRSAPGLCPEPQSAHRALQPARNAGFPSCRGRRKWQYAGRSAALRPHSGTGTRGLSSRADAR